MRIPIWGRPLAALTAAMVLVASAPALAEEQAPSTEEQARAMVARIVREVQATGKIPPGYRAELPLPLLDLLDSPDQQIREVALNGFRELLLLGSLISTTKCLPYLADEATLGERAPLLALCLRQIGRYGETGPKSERTELFNMARKLLNDDVCPPSFDLLASVIGAQHSSIFSSRGRIGFAFPQIVDKDKQELLGRRLLSALDDVGRLYAEDPERARLMQGQVFESVASIGTERMGQHIIEWYRAEPSPEARRVVVAPRLMWVRDPRWAERRKEILELASQDWDAEIAGEARKLLLKLK